MISASGELRDYSVLWHVERDGAGRAFRVFGTASDVTERHRAERALRRAAAVFNTATESIVIANSSGIIIDINSAFSATTGFGRTDVVGRSVDVLSTDRQRVGFFESVIAEVKQCGRWEGEIWIRHKEER